MSINSQKGFLGIDERKKLSDGLAFASNALNFRVNEAGGIEKRSGIAKVCTFFYAIEGIWSGMLNSEETVIIAAGGKLYSVLPNSKPFVPALIGDIGLGEPMIFEFNGAIYIKTESDYFRYDGNTLSQVEGYIPCVAISCTSSGEGVSFEPINLLSEKRRQLFSCDGSAILYKLAESDIEEIVSVTVNGEKYTGNYSISEGNAVSFQAPPQAGLNNMEITYKKPHASGMRERILKCKRIMLFGGNSNGRAFLWGNEDLPNYRFHSELADGVPSVEYFPVSAYTVIGNSKITGIVQQYDKQLIFTKSEAYYSYSELITDALGNISASFPVYSLNASKGSIIEADGCIIDNRPVTLCDDGLNMWESTSVENERNAICFSAPIKETLKQILSARGRTHIFDFQSRREMYLISDDTAIVYNYGNGCFYKHRGFGGNYYSVCGQTLYFANADTVYAFGELVDEKMTNGCRWESPFIDVGTQNGRCDITECTADIFVNGATELRFDFEKSNGEIKTRRFSFPEGTDRFMRITFRPALRRAMPFKLCITESGSGKCVIHGISIKTRHKERSNRFGLL